MTARSRIAIEFMTRRMLFVAACALIALTNCKSATSKPNTAAAEQTAGLELPPYLDAAFFGNDILMTRGVGISSPRALSPLQHEAAAKSQARSAAQIRANSICRNERKAKQDRELYRFKLDPPGNFLTQARQTIKTRSCSPDTNNPELTRCEMTIAFAGTNFKQRCEENRADTNGTSEASDMPIPDLRPFQGQ